MSQYIAPDWRAKLSLFARLFPRRRSADPAALAVFFGRQGAFVAQKTVLDYCNVKSGRFQRETFADPDFQAALQHCRWTVYLAAMSDVTALAEAWLRPHAADREALAAGLVALHDRALAAEVAPPERERTALEASRLALPGRLARLQLGAPKPANKLPLEAEAPLFATLPIHPDQRIGEGPSIRGALRFHVVAAQQEMERAFEAEKLAPAVTRLGASQVSNT